MNYTVVVQLRSEILDFISPESAQAIRDPVWKHIYLPRSFLPLTTTSAFVKLQGIKQLGPTSIVYPGATHTRFNHSLGVYHVARRFVEHLVGHLETNSNCSSEGIRAFLAAALMHDLGHFPYTHSLKELPLREHEALTADIVQGSEIANILKNATVDPALVAVIVDKDLPTDSKEIKLYRRILSGVLDPDKLDYLNRDAYFCGVPYGVQDLDYVLAQLQILSEGGNSLLAIRESGISAIEHILFAKYLMYKAVYWHRGVRTATAMIKRSLWHALREGILRPESLYHLDDQGLVDLARSVAHPYLEAIDQVHRSQIYPCLLETRFDPVNATHAKLSDLELRAGVENDIAELLGLRPHSVDGSCDILVDLPEAISFEVDMSVVASGQSMGYLQASTVFTAPVVRDFTEKLRMIRVFAKPEAAAKVERQVATLRTYFGTD